MLIRFKGRKTGKEYTTPVLYIRNGETIQCFTTKTTKWWKNMEKGSEVGLRLGGCEGRYLMRAVINDPDPIGEALLQLVCQFPQEAPYYEIVLKPDGTPKAETLSAAIEHTVLVEATAK